MSLPLINYIVLQYQCTQPCAHTNKDCSQNHPCTKKCHEECGQCEVRVWKVLPACRHRCQVPCSKDAKLEMCKEDCQRTMACGHKCKKKCFEPCGGCSIMVSKRIPFCGHEVSVGLYEVHVD